MRTSRTAMLAAGLAAGAILSATVTAIAAIPDSDTGKITACRSTEDGSVRVIDAQKGADCKKGEKPLVWNQRGRTGSTGARGPKGNRGAVGPAGVIGTITMTNGVGPTGVGDPAGAVVTLSKGVTWTVPAETYMPAYLSLEGPTSIGGKQYRPISVQYCVEFDSVIPNEATSHIYNVYVASKYGLVQDEPDRYSSGCVTIATTDLSVELNEMESYQVEFDIGGQPGDKVTFRGVSSTWAEVTSP